jgi:hypothetical protein
VALDRRLGAIRGWLRPGGTFVFIEARADGAPGWLAGPAGLTRTFEESDLLARLERHGLHRGMVAAGGRSLIAGAAEAAPPMDATVREPAEAAVGTRGR